MSKLLQMNNEFNIIDNLTLIEFVMWTDILYPLNMGIVFRSLKKGKNVTKIMKPSEKLIHFNISE